jgi:hypothetical protein
MALRSTMMNHYMHFLSDNYDGTWIHPSEPEIRLGATYVVPVDENGIFFPTYQVDYVRRLNIDIAPKMHSALGKKVDGENAFTVQIGLSKFTFTDVFEGKKLRKFKYVGKFQHPDFEFELAEVYNLESLDKLFEEESMLVVGCEPFFHYKEK